MPLGSTRWLLHIFAQITWVEALLGKYTVIKEIVQQGTGKRLEQMMGKATAEALISS